MKEGYPTIQNLENFEINQLELSDKKLIP